MSDSIDPKLCQILSTFKTIAVVGLSVKPDRPANTIPTYLQQQGYRIIPVNPSLTEALGDWIGQAQAAGTLSPALPGEVILYTIFARSCDPVADFLKMGGAFSDDDIVDLVVHTCFEGISGRT